MRPTAASLLSRTFFPISSSTLTSTFFLLFFRFLVPTTGNTRDEVTSEPNLPIDGAAVFGLYVDSNMLSDVNNLCPGNANRPRSFRTPLGRKPSAKPRDGGMNPGSECRSADFDVGNARLSFVAELHDEAIYPTHFFVVLVEELLVENVPHEKETHPPIISSGMEITARTKETMMTMATTELLIQPFRYSPR